MTEASQSEALNQLLCRHDKLLANLLGSSATERSEFVQTIVDSGRRISDEVLRDTALNLLLYWVGEQISLGERRLEDSRPILEAYEEALDPQGATDLLKETLPLKNARAFLQVMSVTIKHCKAVLSSLTPKRHIAVAGEVNLDPEKRARTILRISAIGRQWKFTEVQGAKDEYLLKGAALKEAMLYQDADPDIRALVIASNLAATKRLQKNARNRYFVYGAVSVALLIILSFQFGLPELQKNQAALLRDPLRSDTAKNYAFSVLGFFQGVLFRQINSNQIASSPLTKIEAPNVTLIAPNFTKSVFRSVNFGGAILPNSQFILATFDTIDTDNVFRSALLDFSIFDDAELNNVIFQNTSLSYVRFNRSRINASNFDGANLFHATFDGASLSDVSFSGANLRGASFSFAKFRPNLSTYFDNSPWWLASGWNFAQYDKLRLVDLAPAGVPDLNGFKSDLGIVMRSVEATEKGSLDRAHGLNDLAWTLATWGAITEGSATIVGPIGQPCDAQVAIPAAALEAVQQAICIVETLNAKLGQENGISGPVASIGAMSRLKYSRLLKKELGNCLDTLAYIEIEKGNLAEARNILEFILKTIDSDDVSTGTRFRLLELQFYFGQVEQIKEALVRLKDTFCRGYQPYSDLRLMSKYMAGSYAKFEALTQSVYTSQITCE